MTDQTCSHMPLIPLVSAYFLFIERKHILAEVRSSFLLGAFIVGIGTILCLVLISSDQEALQRDQLSIRTMAALLIWFGGLIAIFGMPSFRRASFPLLFLLFLVPIPSVLLTQIVQSLQQASTEVASFLFLLAGVPVHRNGFMFELPGMSVVVAEQCSGIRSSISLFITGIVAAHLGLKCPWRRAILILSVFPITVFKNALRIVTLSLLGAYVDQRIMSSALHRAGGTPFFILALLLFGCVLWYLRKSEPKAVARKAN